MDICHQIDPDCKSCGKPVYWKKRIFYLNKLWHLDCFKCSRCRTKLNTDVDENDRTYSKAYLGEDLALRCSKCNEMFERKKLAKLTFRKLDLLNFYENELINANKVGQTNLSNRHYYEQGHHEFKNHNSQQSHHDCKHNHKPHHLNYNLEDANDLNKLIHNHKCIERCKEHRYLKDVNKHHSNDSKNRSPKSVDSSEIYRSLFKSKDLKEQKQSSCSCTGCKAYKKNFKIN